MDYLIGFIIFVEGLSIMMDPNPPINLFGIPKGDTIPYGLNIPVGLLMILFGIFFIYRELKKDQQGKQRAVFENAASEIYSQATDLSKNMDGERVIIKGIIGAGMGSATGIARKIGEKIQRGTDGNYKTIFEVGAGLVGGVIQSDIDNKK